MQKTQNQRHNHSIGFLMSSHTDNKKKIHLKDTSAKLFGIGFPSSFNFSTFLCASFAQVNFDKAFSTSAIVQLHCLAASCF